jgi:hypothetical protein
VDTAARELGFEPVKIRRVKETAKEGRT